MSDYFKINVEDLLFGDLANDGPLANDKLAYLGKRNGNGYRPGSFDEIPIRLEKLLSGQDGISKGILEMTMVAEEIKGKVNQNLLTLSIIETIKPPKN